jgi:Pyridoxamine 5'-phosphate oxidase like
MLTKDDNLLFLENKIQEIKIAIFRPEINTELKLPNSIISTIKTDSDGNIWFFTSCNGEYAKNIDKHFFAYLEYYQKGQDCRLRLSGKASIIEGDSETGNSAVETNSPVNTHLVLIKFKILYAEYIENRQSPPVSMKEKVKTFFTDIFIPHSNRKYDFS